MANFLHGVETVELQKGPVTVTVIKSSVIGLIGIAPKSARNSVILVSSPEDAAQFGSELTGFNIPQALSAIFAQGAGAPVLVINVLDDTANLTAVTAETHTIASGKAKLSFQAIKDLVITNNAGSTTYVKDTDYSIDDFGNIQVLDFAVIAEGSTIKCAYKKLNAGSVTNSQYIGTINTGTDAHTGMQCWDLAFQANGFNPKLLIAPGKSSVQAIMDEMLVKAAKYRAIAIVDAPAGTVVADAIAGRGPSGAINFYTSNKRAYLMYPYLKAYDQATDANQDRPYSQFMAGVMSAVDAEQGFHVSPSNREILGIAGVERTISWAINDPDCNANLLNDAGITTVAQGFGTGIRTWGNRSAAHPSSTSPNNFVCVQRTADVLHESLELAMLPFIDQPINAATIDAIKETVNAFMRNLIQRGALVDGNCTFPTAKNSAADMAAGKLTFNLNFMPPTPAERITFESFIDVSLLKSLAAA